MLVMNPFARPPDRLPVLRTVMTSHCSQLFLSFHIEENIVLEFHPVVHPVSSGIILFWGSQVVFTLTFAENEVI